MKPRDHYAALWAGWLPIFAVNLAYLINAWQAGSGCFPYLEGCVSVSRGLRSGPGLWLFKALALPTAWVMVSTWHSTGQRLTAAGLGTNERRQWMFWLGVTGALFFLVYAAWLGTEGDIYRWLRRYGVVFYFAGTGLAQLLLAAMVWDGRAKIPGSLVYIRRYVGLVALTWLLGVASAFKRQLVDDPAFLDRVENALEWNFALALALAFVALAPVLKPAVVGD